MLSRFVYTMFLIALTAACSKDQQQTVKKASDNEMAEYLAQAKDVEVWLAANSLDSSQLVWPDAIDQPENITTSYSDGMAGKLTFYLELFEATKDKEYLANAEGIGSYLLNHLPQKTDSLKGEFWAFSPYGNVCGPAFALTELYKATGNQEYKQGAISIVDVLKHFADNSADSISWDLGNDVLGGLSGTGLFLLYMHKELGHPEALKMAVKSGNTLLARAIEQNGGLTWKRGQNSRFILPNFSHGPAGIGYFFASLFQATGDQSFMQAALKSVLYLDSVANTENDAYLIPYGFPDNDWDRAYDIGWAHGPAGVARLFIKLHQITEEATWMEKAQACYRGILISNPMGNPSEGFGTTSFGIDQRFGLAGVARFTQDMYQYTGEPEYLVFSEELVKYILSKSQREPGLFWTQERFSFMSNAGKNTVFTGLFYGSVGFGSMLINQYNVMKNQSGPLRFVDDPFTP